MKKILLGPFRDTSTKYALVDDSDYDFITQWNWSVCGTTGYARRNIYLKTVYENGERCKKYGYQFMHRVLMGAEQGQFVDHKNRDRLDNRRENLRFATCSQNQANRIQPNTSGFRGVSREGKSERFRARIRIMSKRYEYRGFKTAEEAAKKYDEEARKLFGEFAILNFPDSDVLP